MNANQIAFGIEFETTLPARDDTPIGSYHHGTQVPWLPSGWKAESDSSIRPTTPYRKGCEFVSPKLRGAEGLAEVERALDAINARNAKVNPSCGLHITITWEGDAAALARLISLVGNHEKAIFASTGTRRREQIAYAKPIKPYGDIRLHGLRNDIVLYEGKVLDGRNRLAACKIAKVEPRFVEWSGTGSPTEWVISENLVRRHLSASQRAVIALDILPLLEKEAKERQRQSNSYRGNGRSAKKCANRNGKGKASEAAARIARSNPRYVESVKAINAQAPELLDLIRTGDINVPSTSC